jgi:hypothetical protein
LQPTRDCQTTLVDVLDRVLTKGLILDADVIISVAGIPLLGLKLKAALAGIETMISYGIWEDWDKAQRFAANAEYGGKSDTAITQVVAPGPGRRVITTRVG